MRKKAVLLVPVYVFIFYAVLNADTVYLKNGRSIEGIIKSEDSEVIDLEVYGGSVKFRKGEIEKIDKASSEDSNVLRQKWEKQKLKNQDKILRQQIEEERKPRKIEFSSDRQSIVLGATLNNKVKASLVLDTGASLVVLRRNIAEKLGINLDTQELETKLTLIDGRKVNAKYVILESVEVEGVEAKNVDAAIVLDDAGDLGFGDGLLGMSFLKRFNFKIDQKDKNLILEKL